MTAMLRPTDVLGGMVNGKSCGVVGGFPPMVPFAGWRLYSVTDTYTDPDGLEFPCFRLLKLSGPPTDTIAQVQTRTEQYYVEKTWGFGGGALQGQFPGLAWYLLDPTTMALVAGPLLPIGNAALGSKSQQYRDMAPITDHVLQWFDHTTPITGPYIAVLVAREPSSDFPLFSAGHPVDIATTLLTRKGETYDAASAAACRVALGAELAHIAPITETDDTAQDVIDTFSAAYGFTVRAGDGGALEFVHWREKLGDISALPVIDNNSVRADGGPTFDLSDQSRLTRVRVTGVVLSPWVQGTKTVVDRRETSRLFRRGRPTVIYKTVLTTDNDKPASGLLLNSAEVAFDYSTDGVTPDSDLYGEQALDIELGGMPAFLGSAGEAYPTNLEQFAEGVARLTFDGHARGRMILSVPVLRDSDGDTNGLLGEALAVDLDHVLNPQLGQSPTSQRGGLRPFRVVERTPQPTVGPFLTLVDEGTGVQYAPTPTLVLWTDPLAVDMLRVNVSDAATLATDGAQVEFQVRVFGPTAPYVTADPGARFTVKDSTLWTDDPQMVRLGPFPPLHKVIVRARAWLYGGAASDWSLWYGTGGPITGPGTTLSNLVISNYTDEGADLDWSYDESPQVGDVKVQYRDITSGFAGPYTDYTGSPFAPGTESLTLVGLTAGKVYEVRLVLVNPAEYGDVLTGSFPTTGGSISALIVSSVTAGGAKLNWTNTDGSRQIFIEYRVTGDPLWSAFGIFAPTTNRMRLTGLASSTAYDVQVSLLSGFYPAGDGIGGPPLTDSFTTLAASVQLDFPHTGGPFWDFDPATSSDYDGRFGLRLHANPNNKTVDHVIVVFLAEETAVDSETPGAFVEQTPIPATPGIDLWFVADAPNDDKKRYMYSISRDPTGAFLDSDPTITEEATPWADTGPQPPAGGGITNTHTITATAVGAGASVTGFFAVPDGAEMFRLESPNGKEIRIRLYTDSTELASDSGRASNDSNWPVGILYDGEILASDSFLLDLAPPQRVRFLLSFHENRVVWYRLTNLEVGTEDLECRIYYFAAPTGGTGTLA